MIQPFALIAFTLSVVGISTEAFAQAPSEANIVAQWEANRSSVFEATTVNIEDMIWRARPVVVFADSPNDPVFRQQMDLLAARSDDLAERDVIVIIDTDPSARSDLRVRLRPRGFSMVLIGKDGEVKLRKPAPWDGREISRSIDKMPIRQQEVEDRREDP